MGAMASQITSLTIVYSTVYSGADQGKHQSSASLADDSYTRFDYDETEYNILTIIKGGNMIFNFPFHILHSKCLVNGPRPLNTIKPLI